MNELKIIAGSQEREFKDLGLHFDSSPSLALLLRPSFPKKWGTWPSPMTHPPRRWEVKQFLTFLSNISLCRMQIKIKHEFLLPCFVYNRLPSILIIP